MNFRDNPEVPYTNATIFTQEQLLTITPEQLCRWMKKKVYGTPDPGPEDKPTEGRASSIQFAKKAISSFMPNKMTPWDEVLKRGNPTRSICLNDLIRMVKKKQVRREGKETSAVRPLESAEFEQMLDLLHKNNHDTKKKYMIGAAAKFQYAMVARVDDVANFKADELSQNFRFNFALTAKMAWSKNINEERDAPEQILFGSMNTTYCVLIGLAVFLEVSFGEGLGLDHSYLFGHTDRASTNRNFISKTLTQVWKSPEFHKLKEGKIGTHSLRKYPATRSRQSGCSADEMDTRGRWKKGRVSDVYVSTTLPYPDAKVAAALCPGGPCKYRAAEGSGLSDPWLLENIVPEMVASNKIANRVALTLSKPLLWAACNEGTADAMPVTLRNRIREAYASIRPASFEEANPIRQIPIIVTGKEAELHIDEVVPLNRAAQGHDAAGGGQMQDGGFIPLTQALYSRVVGLESQQ